jgi:hypothetical protein
VSSRPAPVGIASVLSEPAAGKLSAKVTKPVEELLLLLLLLLLLPPVLALLLPLLFAPLLFALLLGATLLALLAFGLPALPILAPLPPPPPQADSAIDVNKQTIAALLIPSPFEACPELPGLPFDVYHSAIKNMSPPGDDAFRRPFASSLTSR